MVSIEDKSQFNKLCSLISNCLSRQVQCGDCIIAVCVCFSEVNWGERSCMKGVGSLLPLSSAVLTSPPLPIPPLLLSLGRNFLLVQPACSATLKDLLSATELSPKVSSSCCLPLSRHSHQTFHNSLTYQYKFDLHGIMSVALAHI